MTNNDNNGNSGIIRLHPVPLDRDSINKLKKYWDVGRGTVAIQLTLLKFIDWIDDNDNLLLLLKNKKVVEILERYKNQNEVQNENNCERI